MFPCLSIFLIHSSGHEVNQAHNLILGNCNLIAECKCFFNFEGVVILTTSNFSLEKKISTLMPSKSGVSQEVEDQFHEVKHTSYDE